MLICLILGSFESLLFEKYFIKMALGIGDRVKILKAKNMMLIGRISKIASICGKGGGKQYHLEIDGEKEIFISKNLALIEKANVEQPKKK